MFNETRFDVGIFEKEDGNLMLDFIGDITNEKVLNLLSLSLSELEELNELDKKMQQEVLKQLINI